MVYDVIIGIVAITAFYRGYTKGLVAAVLSLVGVLLGTVLSLKLAHILASFVAQSKVVNSAYVLPLSFILIFVATLFLINMLTKAIEGILKFAMLGWVNKLVGAVVYSVLAMFVLSAIFMLATNLGIITTTAANSSKAYNYIQPIGPKGIELFGKIIPYCSNVVQEVKAIMSK